MAAVVFRRGKWLVDYRDKNGTRRWLAVEGSRAEAEAELKRLANAGELWVPTKRRTRRAVVRDRKLEEASRKPTAGLQHHTHGLTTLRKAVAELAARGLNPIDETTEAGQALMQWRCALVTDLGGDDALSTQQRYIVDLTCRLRLMLDSIDAWLLAQPTLINRQRRSLFPVVSQRTALADSLTKNLETLGLRRQAREIRLSDYINLKGNKP
ncbi:MAG: hypothetical protein ACREXS_17080 [Gammaproteobacteria bacterium]